MSRNDLCQWPILGELTPQQLKEVLIESITDEANTIDFYARMMRDAPNDLFYSYFEHARAEEEQHLEMFKNLYCCCFNERPQYTTSRIQFSSYKEGVLMALNSEMEAADKYKDVQLSVRNQIVRDTFYFAMVDELEHATRFSTLLNML